MLKEFTRKCDHCNRVIKIGTGYLWAKIAVHTDVPGIPNVVAPGTRIDDEKIVELHKKCASEYFRQPDALPEVRKLLPPPPEDEDELALLPLSPKRRRAALPAKS